MCQVESDNSSSSDIGEGIRTGWTTEGRHNPLRNPEKQWDLRRLRPHMLAVYSIDEPLQFTGASGYASDDPKDVIEKGWRNVFIQTKTAVNQSFPDLPVTCQGSIRSLAGLNQRLENPTKKRAGSVHLNRATISVLLNLGEGKGKDPGPECGCSFESVPDSVRQKAFHPTDRTGKRARVRGAGVWWPPETSNPVPPAGKIIVEMSLGRMKVRIHIPRWFERDYYLFPCPWKPTLGTVMNIAHPHQR